VATIPQIFVGGELIGGCTEVLDAMQQGRLSRDCWNAALSATTGTDADPYSFLPGWLQRR